MLDCVLLTTADCKKQEWQCSGKSILAKDNLLEDVGDEHELDADAHIEEHLEAVASVVRLLEQQLDEAEKRFQVKSIFSPFLLKYLMLNYCHPYS